ncbi:putative ent-kaurene monooxygenase [Helianthus anomalus]
MDVQTVRSAAVAFGGPAVAVVGGVSLLFLKSVLSHQGGGSSNPNHLPFVPVKALWACPKVNNAVT